MTRARGDDGVVIATPQPFAEALETAPLNAYFWRALALLVLAVVFDFFDFFLVGFLMAVVGPAWHMTYAQVSIVLVSAGVGSIVSGLVSGWLADVFGRKIMIIAGVALASLGSGLVGFVPDGAWHLFAALRFLVGLGLAATSTGVLALTVEMTPLRVRTVISGAMAIPASIGILIASTLASQLMPVAGWRGLALCGLVPLLLVIPMVIFVPESARWLAARGRREEAARVVSRQIHRPVDLPPPPQAPRTGSRGGLIELLAYPRQLLFILIIWLAYSTVSYAISLWGPTILAMRLTLTPAKAAGLFALVGLGGLIGRIVFSILPQFIGRRRSGQLTGAGMAVGLTIVAFAGGGTVGTVPLLLVALVASALFFDGGGVNIAPIPAEIFPARLAGRGSGFGQAANGIGKVLGPVALALIAGANDFVSPKATAASVTPAFLLLAACGVATFLAFTLLGVETHRQIARDEDHAADLSV